MNAYRTLSETLHDRISWATAILQGHAPVAETIAARIASTPHDVRVTPIEWLAMRLGLGPREVELLWMLALVELEPAVTKLAHAVGEITVMIASRLLGITGAELSELQRLGLIECGNDPRVAQHRRALRINDRVLEIARGDLRLDPELEGVAAIRSREDRGDAEPLLVRALTSDDPPVIMAVGPDGAGRATVLSRAAGERGFGTLRVASSELDAPRLERQLRAIVREACLFDLVPMFEDVGTDDARAIERATRRFAGPVLVTAREQLPWSRRPVVSHVVARPRTPQLVRLWSAALPGVPAEVIAGAATSFSLRPGAVHAAAANALAAAGGRTADVTPEMIHAGVRARIGDELAGLATRVEATQTWEDLVLPPEQLDLVTELMARVRHRATVLDRWGFGAKVGKGHGLAALFSGPPGTGKTMVAGLVARELGLDLYQVDLSKIVSKYIGETERQLATLFDAAEAGHAILLFDEADSLFAKRTEVRSSNDRYANLEVNFLLQRMESFTGISILTTNHEAAIDEAFRRRLALHVRFPMPDEAQRSQLWRALIPATAPTADRLSFSALGELELSGGYIKNAVLRAAYLAANDGAPIAMAHLERAARAECEAIGMLLA